MVTTSWTPATSPKGRPIQIAKIAPGVVVSVMEHPRGGWKAMARAVENAPTEAAAKAAAEKLALPLLAQPDPPPKGEGTPSITPEEDSAAAAAGWYRKADSDKRWRRDYGEDAAAHITRNAEGWIITCVVDGLTVNSGSAQTFAAAMAFAAREMPARMAAN